MTKRADHKVTLKVRSADAEDVYKDIVRISESSRSGLKTGRIHRFSTSKGAAYFILRGSGPENDGKILMDEAARSKLNLEASVEREFAIHEVGFWGELRWVWNATDPTYRIAGRLGVLSLLLGLLAIVPIASDIGRYICDHVRHLIQ
jgi:hypothetical protein